MNTLLSFLAASVPFCCSVAHAKSPVTFSSSLTPDPKDPLQTTLNVTVEIGKGYHLYAKVPEEIPFKVTEVTFSLPESVQKVDDLVVPPGTADSENRDVLVYGGTVVFSQGLRLKEPAKEAQIGVTVNYQACDDHKCLLPAKWETTVTVPAGGPKSETPKAGAFENKYFTTPERLMAMGSPVSMSLPSPGLFDLDGDGRNELVVGGVVGSLNFYHNTNKASGDPVWSRPMPLKSTADKPIRVNNWCCVGMSPQQIDLNGDGCKDIIVGCFEGVPQLIEGSKSGFLEPVGLKDSGGEAIILRNYYDKEKNEWASSERAGGKGHCTSVTAVDWDADGDEDLLLGDKEGGGIYLRLNEGTSTKPALSTKNQTINAGGNPMVCPDGLSSSRIADWDGDGLFDIICGGLKGGVYVFRNTGKKGQPAFGAAACLIEPVVKHIYNDVVPVANGQPLMPGSFYHIETCDYDGDGDLDLLVGGLCSWPNPEFKPRTESEVRELEAKRKESVELLRKIPQDRDAYGKFISSPEGREIHKKYKALQAEVGRAEGKEKLSGNFVWLFRRK